MGQNLFKSYSSDIIINGILDSSGSGYMQYFVTGSDSIYYLRLSHPQYVDLYRKMKIGAPLRLEYDVMTNDILSVSNPEIFSISGIIEDFLTLHNEGELSEEIQKTMVEVILTERPIDVPKRGYIRIFLKKERMERLPRGVPLTFQVSLFANTNKYLISDIFTSK